MDQQADIALGEADPRGGLGVEDLLDALHLAEVVAAADRAQALARCSGETRLGRAVGICAVLKHAQPPRGLVDLQPATRKIQPPERHAAADVRPHELGPDPVGEKGGADRTMAAGMQVRKARHGFHAGLAGRLGQLVFRKSLDPGLAAVEGSEARALGDAALGQGDAHRSVSRSRRRRAAAGGSAGVRGFPEALRPAGDPKEGRRR